MTVKLVKQLQSYPPGYNVYVDGTVVGEVYQVVQRYNLRRVLVTRQWFALTYPHRFKTEHNLRREAVDELVKSFLTK